MSTTVASIPKQANLLDVLGAADREGNPLTRWLHRGSECRHGEYGHRGGHAVDRSDLELSGNLGFM